MACAQETHATGNPEAHKNHNAKKTARTTAMNCARSACKAELPKDGPYFAIFNQPSTDTPRLYCSTCGQRIISANKQYDTLKLEFQVRTFATTFTDAPTDYDGFGTTTIKLTGEKTNRGPVREVSTPKKHANWQRNRYESGCYLALDPDKYQSSKWFFQ